MTFNYRLELKPCELCKSELRYDESPCTDPECCHLENEVKCTNPKCDFREESLRDFDDFIKPYLKEQG